MTSTILRIYFPISARRRGRLSFWQKMFHSSLGGFLLKQAKEYGIEQTILQRILGGYLKGKKLVFDAVEAVPNDFPLCVEMIDNEEKLKSFVAKFKDQLLGCRVVLFQGAQLLPPEAL